MTSHTLLRGGLLGAGVLADAALKLCHQVHITKIISGTAAAETGHHDNLSSDGNERMA